MLGRQSHKSVQIATQSESDGDNGPPSQTTTDMLKTAQDLVTSSKQRREARRSTIEVEHERKEKDVMAHINALLESRKSQVTKYQKAQWDRLDALNKQRASLEALIVASMRSIEQHSANISNEMGAIFAGRIEDIQESTASQPATVLVNSCSIETFQAPSKNQQ